MDWVGEAGEGEVLTRLTLPVGVAACLAFGVTATVCRAVGALLASTLARATMVVGSGPGELGTAIHLPVHRRETPRPASPGRG